MSGSDSEDEFYVDTKHLDGEGGAMLYVQAGEPVFIDVTDENVLAILDEESENPERVTKNLQDELERVKAEKAAKEAARKEADRIAHENAKNYVPTKPIPKFMMQSTTDQEHTQENRKSIYNRTFGSRHSENNNPQFVSPKAEALGAFSKAVTKLISADNIPENEIQIRTQLHGILSTLKEPFDNELECDELTQIIYEFTTITNILCEDPGLKNEANKNSFHQKLSDYNAHEKSKLSPRLKTILAMVIGGIIGALVGFCAGFCIGGVGSIPFMCAGAAIGCSLGSGIGAGIRLTLFGKTFDLHGAANDASQKIKSDISQRLNLGTTLTEINKLFPR